MEKCEKVLPPLKRKKLSKKAKERDDLIKKNLYETNRWWNDWRFQLNWNILEWVDQNQELDELNPFKFLQISSISTIMIEQLILLVILN